MKVISHTKVGIKLLILSCISILSLSIHPPIKTFFTEKLNNSINAKSILKKAESLPPPNPASLLVDISVNNTTPSANDIFIYKIRYRYASTTEHGTNAQIQLTFPSAYDVILPPQTGGNISNISNSGNQYTISLESPSSLGLPSGTLAAGASGIFEFRAKFMCGTNGSGGIPNAGNTVNLTQNPVFTVSGVSNTAAGSNAVTVPTVNVCTPPPASSGSSVFKKNGPDVIGQGMISLYSLYYPTSTQSETYTEIFPAVEFKLYAFQGAVTFSPGWTVEVQANGSWWNISNKGSYYNWIHSVANGGQLTDDNGTPIPGVVRVDAAQPNITFGGSANYADNLTGVRLTSPSSGASSGYFFCYFYTPLNTPVGWYQNCYSTTQAGYSTDCHDTYVTDRGALTMGCWFQAGNEGLGGTELSKTHNSFLPNNYPNLYKDPMDLQGIVNTEMAIKTNKVEGYRATVLLPEGFDFIEGSSTPNYWVVKSYYLDSDNSPAALTPTFTRTPNYNGTGRVLIEWNFPNLVFPQWAEHYNNNNQTKIRIYYSIRYMGTIPLIPNTNIEAYTQIYTNTVMTRTDGGINWYATPTQNLGCTVLSSYPPNSSGAVNSEKYVQGALDIEQSRYPISGNTNLSGDATYEMYIHNHNFQGLKEIDVADILPYIGDKDMLSTTSRGSGWSEELANAITVERYKIGTGLIDASSKIPSGVLYSNTYNACYLDGALPTGQVTANMAAANTGQSAGCTDFSNSITATGAKGFTFRWTDNADPLTFGEYLKITVNVNQLTGEIDMTNNEVAWNSFAYTATETDNDVLFSSEPLKVGVKMVDMVNKANICGLVWKDDNANGRREAGEILVDGITVSLYNAAGNPITEAVTTGGVTTNVPVTRITDSDGAYCFYGLNPTTNYHIRLENENNFTLSGGLANLELTVSNTAGVLDTEDSDAVEGTLSGSPATARPQIAVTTGAAGTTSNNNDFGFYGFGSIGNYVWNDDDADGAQDKDETPVQGVTMSLYKVGGFFVESQITDANGRYLFTNQLPGNYYIVASTLPASKIPTVKNATGNNDNDSDFGSNLQTDNFNLSSGQAISYIDLGIKIPIANPASICGRTWDDFDSDGIIDGTEPKMGNITVQLLDATGFVLTTTTTDNNGDYCFNNLTPNQTYKVGFVLPTPTASSFTNAGADMDANSSTGLTGTYTPTSNQNITNVDAGIIGPFSIGNLVWFDTNNNGTKEASESAFSNVKVYLIDNSNGDYIASTTTDAYGKYVFKNLIQDSYIVEIELPDNMKSSTDIGNTNTPNATDNDDNGIGVATSGRVRSNTITLQAGGGSNSGANWSENDHGEVINGELDPASNPKAYYTMDFGLVAVELNCTDGIDNDGDGFIDCLDPDCGIVTITNSTISSCINQPYADVAKLDVTVSWSSAPEDSIAVTIVGKTTFINTNNVTSPATVSFMVPADGSTNNLITTNFKNKVCNTTSTYNAPAACSNDKITCSMLYICGESKQSDADAFDHGLMQYIDGINGNAVLEPALAKNEAGMGLYDPNNSSSALSITLTDYDVILVSSTTWGYLSSDLKTALKNTSANILLLLHDAVVDLGLGSSAWYSTQSYGYSDNTTKVELYNFNNYKPRYYPLVGVVNYHSATADAYLWKDQWNMGSNGQGLFFHYDASDALTGVSAAHGSRTFLGYYMDGVYWNEETNGGAMPVPTAEWFDPIRHLTQEGKLYLDQAIQLATQSCSVEDCTDGIDNDGDGLVDCDDPDCYLAANSGDTDNDNDGIGDSCDDDDDNDGILDEEECSLANKITNVIYNNAANGVVLAGNEWATGWKSGVDYIGTDLYPEPEFDSPVREASLSLQNGNKTYSAVVRQHTFPGDPGNNVPASNTWIYYNGNTGASPNEVIKHTLTGIKPNKQYQLLIYVSSALDWDWNPTFFVTTPIVQFSIDGTPVGSDFTIPIESSASGDVWHPLQYTWTTGAAQSSTATLAVIDKHTGGAGGDDLAITYFVVREVCDGDYDNDGTPNHLDLDSDNDNCPDAIEGGGSFTNTDLTANRLSGSVSNNGIPLVIPAGQSVGSSQDENVLSAECDICNPANPQFTDSDGDGVGDPCDDDDDNDGILDIVECPTPTNSGLTGPLTTFTAHITTTNASSNAVPHTLDSITYNGTIYRDFIVPDSYTPGFTLTDQTGVSFVKEGAFLFNIGSNASYNTDILPAFQSRNLNAYQDLDRNDFSNGDYFDLKYNSPVTSTTGGFIAVTERGGNNPQVIQALDASGTVIGTTINVSTSDYVDVGVRVDPSGGQNANIALYPIDDLAPVGTEIHGIRLSFGTTSGAASDGPDAKAFLFGNVDLFACDYDGDGIPNNKDLDSDNDGCPDAIEGGGNFTSTDLTADRLTGSVGSDGVPVVVPAGQAVGSSQDAGTSLCNEICNNGIDDDGDGLIDCADTECKPVISTVTVTQPTCANKTGGQIVITASGSGTLSYSINNQPTWQASNTFSGLGVGQYTIRVKNDSDCETEYTTNPITLDFGTCIEICNDGIDNDGDGLIDCDDPDCDNIGSVNGINKN